MERNISYSSEVKKGLIHLLMFSLYSDAKIIYREYVQNAFDSINNAVNKHILEQFKDGEVSIQIDSHNKNVSIKDNGTGISSKTAVRTLLDISASKKDGLNQAGQFGIGRLAGGGYCHELIFRTSSKGESIGTQITFDIDKIDKMLHHDETEYSASYVIDVCTKKEFINADESEHYFEVILKNIKDFASELLDSEQIIMYLNAVAPVEYTSQFYNILIYKSIKDYPEFKNLHEGLEKVQLFVGDKRIQKQYGLSVVGTKDDIDSLEYFKIEDNQYGELGWGWFALTKYSTQISKEDKLAGIRLRIHNILIGDSNFLTGKEYWKEERGNSYFYGEIFVTHPNIGPNAARDGLAATLEAQALKSKLREYFVDLKNLYTKANEAKKAIDKINEGVARIENNNDDYYAKDLINNKGIKVFEKLLRNASFDPIVRMLNLYKPDFEEAKKRIDEVRNAHTQKQTNTTTEEQSQSDRRTSSTGVAAKVCDDGGYAFGDVIDSEGRTEVTNERVACSTESYNSDPICNPDLSIKDTTDAKDIMQETCHPVVTDQSEDLLIALQPTSTPLLNQNDMTSALRPFLDESEIRLINRVFRVMDSYCPANEHDQLLISKMKRQIVKEFEDAAQ